MAALLQLMETAQAQEDCGDHHANDNDDGEDDDDERLSVASLESDEADLAIRSVLEQDFGGMVDFLLTGFGGGAHQSDLVAGRVADGSSISAARRSALGDEREESVEDLPLAALAAGQRQAQSSTLQGRATEDATWVGGSSAGTPRRGPARAARPPSAPSLSEAEATAAAATERDWTPRRAKAQAFAVAVASSPRPHPLPPSGRPVSGGRPSMIVCSPSPRERRTAAAGSPLNLCRARRRAVPDTLPPGSPTSAS